MSKNKMHKHTRQLEERELLFTELSRSQAGPKSTAEICSTRSVPPRRIDIHYDR